MIPLEVRSKLIDEGGKQIIVSITRDISGRAEIQRELERLASTDRLTGIYNRHFFETILDKELERVNSYDLTLTLIMFDIDHFKVINDTCGHTIGDAVLARIALIVADEIRKADIFSCCRGKEFMILCSGIDRDSGVMLAEKLRIVISNNTFATAGKVTSSFGVTGHRRSDSKESLRRRVDELLYEAKASGRNRVIAG